MAFADDEELLSEYVQWQVLNGGKDKTPSTFLAERAKADALGRLIRGIEFIQDNWEFGDNGLPRSVVMRELYEILGGEEYHIIDE